MLVVVLIVSVSVTGLPAIGWMVLDGWNAQLAPEGSPEQFSATGSANEPDALTWNVALADAPWDTVTGFGLTEPMSKSTRRSVSVASCVIVFASLPTAWAMKV